MSPADGGGVAGRSLWLPEDGVDIVLDREDGWSLWERGWGEEELTASKGHLRNR